MAVIVQYIVVRNGVEKMKFTTKKEADAYDKMLDIADNLFGFLQEEEFEINEQQLEDLSFFLAQNKDKTISILKGTKPPKKNEPTKAESEKIDPEKSEEEKTEAKKKDTSSEKVLKPKEKQVKSGKPAKTAKKTKNK